MYSILQTAKLNGVNPEAYLRETLAKIADWHPRHDGRRHRQGLQLVAEERLVPAPASGRFSDPLRRPKPVFASKDGQVAVLSTMSAAFSPIMIDGALVLPDVSVGMIEASATRRPAMPWTQS